MGAWRTEAAETLLDPTSEAIFAWEQEGFPQADYGAYVFEGRCEPEILKNALLAAQTDFPKLHGHLVPTWRRGRDVFVWHTCRAPSRVTLLDRRSEVFPREELEARIHGELSKDISALWDLRVEHPSRFRIILFPADVMCLTVTVHHVAIDAGGVYDFLQEVLRRYHEKVTGQNPPWAGVAGIHAQAGKAPTIRRMTPRELLQTGWTRLRRYPSARVCQMASRGDAPTGRRIIRCVIDDPKAQKALRDRARRSQGTVTDLAVAASKLALQEWNRARGAPAEVMHHGLAVNQRLRRPEVKLEGNPMSAIILPSDQRDRADPERLLQHVIRERMRRLDAGLDIQGSDALRKLVVASRVLPLSIRYQWLRRLMDRKISFFVTNVGIVWPEFKDGRLTGDTRIKRVGDMELVDVFSSIGATKNNPSAYIIRTLRRRLSFMLSVGRHAINVPDAQAFSDLIQEKLWDYV